MGKGLKKVVKAVAPIAIGFVAGPIAGAIFKSASIATATSIAGKAFRLGTSALVGAGLGAATGVGASAGAFAGAAGQFLGGRQRYSNGLRSLTSAGSPAAGTTARTAIPTTPTATAGSTAATAPAAAAAAPQSLSQRIVSGLAGIPSKLASRMGDIVTAVAVNGIAAAIASAKTPEEKAFLQENARELELLKERSNGEYEFKRNVTELLMQRAREFDPQRFAMAAAADAKTMGEERSEEAIRRLKAQGGGRMRGAEDVARRKYAIATDLNSDTAYYRAFNDRQGQQTAAIRDAAATYPTWSNPGAAPARFAAARNVSDAQGGRAKNLAALFGDLSTSTPEEDQHYRQYETGRG